MIQDRSPDVTNLVVIHCDPHVQFSGMKINPYNRKIQG